MENGGVRGVDDVPGDLDQMQKTNAYSEFQNAEGVPSITGFAIEDLKVVDLYPWRRKGGKGVYINLDGAGGTNDAYLCEIPPGGSLEPQRHMFEEMIYVVEGNGVTSVWYEENRKATFEWKTGSMFAIPLNAWHRHFNGQGNRPARYLAITNAPIVMNLFHNTEFIFNNPFVFKDRFGGEERFFADEGKLWQARSGRIAVLESNFVPDTHGMKLYARKRRGAGGKSVFFELANNTMAAHISEFPVGTYKLAHRHGPGAHVIILSGKGYSLVWPDGAEPRPVFWKAGSMVVPPNGWWHQHFNSGAEPSRYLALRWGSLKYDMSDAIFWGPGAEEDVVKVRNQIEYDEEDPKVHEMFEAELAKSGAVCRMRSMIKGCTGTE